MKTSELRSRTDLGRAGPIAAALAIAVLTGACASVSPAHAGPVVSLEASARERVANDEMLVTIAS